MGAAARAKNGGSRISIGGGLGCGALWRTRREEGGRGVLRNLKLHLQNKYRFYSCCMFIRVALGKAAGVLASHVLPASAQPPLAVSSRHTLPSQHHSVRWGRGKIRMPSQAARFLLLWVKDLNEGTKYVCNNLWLRSVLAGQESNLGVAKDKGICPCQR